MQAKTVVKEELHKRKSILSKIKYLLYAYKFELIVFCFIAFFIGFFARSIFIHDNAVLNVAIYTSSPKQPTSVQVSSTQEKINKALHINYKNHRNTSEVIAGSTKKISDEMKLQSMLSAKQVDILVLNKHGFNSMKTKKNTLLEIPKELSSQLSAKHLYKYKGKVYGVSAHQLPILKDVSNSNEEIFCLPANGKNKNERTNFINYMVQNLK